MAMSYLPPMRLVSWNTELTVGVSLTSIPFLANSPFSWAIQTGQLNPPGNTMSSTALGGAGWATAHDAMSSAIGPARSLLIRCMVLSLIDRFPAVKSELHARLRVRSRHGLQRRLFVLLVGAEFRNVRGGSPHAERLGRQREMSRAVRCIF